MLRKRHGKASENRAAESVDPIMPGTVQETISASRSNDSRRNGNGQRMANKLIISELDANPFEAIARVDHDNADPEDQGQTDQVTYNRTSNNGLRRDSDHKKERPEPIQEEQAKL